MAVCRPEPVGLTLTAFKARGTDIVEDLFVQQPVLLGRSAPNSNVLNQPHFPGHCLRDGEQQENEAAYANSMETNKQQRRQQRGRNNRKPIGQAENACSKKGRNVMEEGQALQPGLVFPPAPARPVAESEATPRPIGQAAPMGAAKSKAAPRPFGKAEPSGAEVVPELGDAETVAGFFSEGMTTVMIRNIPNRYICEELLSDVMHAGFENQFDFFYLPIDFKTKRNRGYAFINFHSADFARQFVLTFHSRPLTRYPTKKVLEVAPATTQGYDENVKQFSKKDGCRRVNNQWFKPIFFKMGEDSEQ